MTSSYGPLQAIQLLSKTFLSKVHSLMKYSTGPGLFEHPVYEMIEQKKINNIYIIVCK